MGRAISEAMGRSVRVSVAARAVALCTAIALVALGCRAETPDIDALDSETPTPSATAAPTASEGPESPATPRPTDAATPALTPAPAEAADDLPPVLNLTLVDSYDLATDTGLREPSGLALNPLSGGLWSVSDTGETLFGLNDNGDPIDTVRGGDLGSSGLGRGMEGLALGEQSAWTVTEDGNWIIETDLATAEINTARAIDDFDGYDSIGSLIEAGGENKGLEGITLDIDNDRIFVVKEGRPGVLIELSPDLTSITNHWILNSTAGFTDPDTDEKDLDFSGLSHDRTDDTMWIVSDKGRRVFLFDLAQGQVINSFAIDAVDKAEGIALDRSNGVVHVVSESDATIYTYAIG